MRFKDFYKVVFVLALAGLFIYLFFIPYAYVIRLKSDYAPFAVYSFISDHSTQIEEKDGILLVSHVLQNVNDEIPVNLLWKIKSDGDYSNIKINVSFSKNQYLEKLKVLLFRSSLLKNTIERIKAIQKNMQKELSFQHWSFVENDYLPASTCLCTSLSSKMRDKPKLMNAHVDELAFYSQNIANKPPRLYINEIDFLNQSFVYEFCFPLNESGVRQPLPEAYYVKKQPRLGSSSVNYYGNYAATPRAWSNIYDSLRLENKQINFPIAEVFIDSPFSGKEDKDWLCKIYF